MRRNVGWNRFGTSHSFEMVEVVRGEIFCVVWELLSLAAGVDAWHSLGI